MLSVKSSFRTRQELNNAEHSVAVNVRNQTFRRPIGLVLPRSTSHQPGSSAALLSVTDPLSKYPSVLPSLPCAGSPPAAALDCVAVPAGAQFTSKNGVIPLKVPEAIAFPPKSLTPLTVAV